MNSKLMVGVSADYRGARKDAPAFTFLDSGYYDAIVRAGAVPIIIPPLHDAEDVGHILDRLDAVVLAGGADLDPRRDGYILHPTVRLLDERREVFDRMLMDMVADRRLPVLGIGVGMQLLNVSQGGTLFLHLPEDFPDGLAHYDLLDASHRHALMIEEGTLVERVYGEGDVRVNSMHHMACDDVAPGFQVTARCPDGVIEVIESARPDWFAMGTQFHPEAQSATALDIRIFHEFVEEVARRKTVQAELPAAA